MPPIKRDGQDQSPRKEPPKRSMQETVALAKEGMQRMYEKQDILNNQPPERSIQETVALAKEGMRRMYEKQGILNNQPPELSMQETVALAKEGMRRMYEKQGNLDNQPSHDGPLKLSSQDTQDRFKAGIRASAAQTAQDTSMPDIQQGSVRPQAQGHAQTSSSTIGTHEASDPKVQAGVGISPPSVPNDSVQNPSSNCNNTTSPEGLLGAGSEQPSTSSLQSAASTAEAFFPAPTLLSLSFDLRKISFQHWQRTGFQSMVGPMLTLFDTFESVAIDQIKDAVRDKRHLPPIDKFLVKIKGLSLKNITPIAWKNNNSRAFFDDALIDFLVSDSVAKFNVAENIAWIPACFNDLFFKVNQPFWTDEDTVTFLTQEAENVRAHGVTNSIQWPDLKRASGVTQIVMPINFGSHWTTATFLFGEQVGSIEFRDSSEATRHLQKMQKILPPLGTLLSLHPSVNRPALVWEAPITASTQTQQGNGVDCGPITVYSVIQQLKGRTPVVHTEDTISWCQQLRHDFLEQVFTAVIGTPMPTTPTDPRSSSQNLGGNDGGDNGDEDDIWMLGADGSYRLVGSRNTTKVRSELLRQHELDIVKKISEEGPTPHLQVVWSIISQTAKDPTLEYSGLTVENILRFLPGNLYSESMVTRTVQQTLANPPFEGCYSRSVHFIDAELVQNWLAPNHRERFSTAAEEWYVSCKLHRNFSIGRPDTEANIKELVFPWNLSEHWVTVHAQIGDETGVVSVYNTFEKQDVMEQANDVLPVYCEMAGGILGWPAASWTVVAESCAQQQDAVSCGPMTVENCLGLLQQHKCVEQGFSAATIDDSRLRHLRIIAKLMVVQPDTTKSSGYYPCNYPNINHQVLGPLDPQVQVDDVLEIWVDYKELICNALEEAGPTGAQIKTIMGSVREQINKLRFRPTVEDPYFQKRIEYYLESDKSKMFKSAPGQRWTLQEGRCRSVSTRERQRLASKRPRISSIQLLDFIDVSFDLIVVVGRASRGGELRQERTMDLLKAFWARFGPTNDLPTNTESIENIDDIANLSGTLFTTLEADHYASNTRMLDLINVNQHLVDVLDRLNTVKGKKVLMLQCNVDGSSCELDSFREFLEYWSNLDWSLAIAAHANHKRLHMYNGLWSWGTLDHSKDHTTNSSYEICWFQFDFARLVAIWEGVSTANLLGVGKAHVDLGHEQMVFMMALMFAYKAEPKSTTKSCGIQAVKQNGLVYMMTIDRQSFFLGSPVRKCKYCSATNPISRWLRGVPDYWLDRDCQMLTLCCGSADCVSQMTKSPTTTSVDQADLAAPSRVNIKVNGPRFVTEPSVRKNIRRSEGNGVCKAFKGGRKAYDPSAKFTCEPCQRSLDRPDYMRAHLETQEHIDNIDPAKDLTEEFANHVSEWYVYKPKMTDEYAAALWAYARQRAGNEPETSTTTDRSRQRNKTVRIWYCPHCDWTQKYGLIGLVHDHLVYEHNMRKD